MFFLFLCLISQKVDSRRPLEIIKLERSFRGTYVSLLEIYKPVPPALVSDALWVNEYPGRLILAEDEGLNLVSLIPIISKECLSSFDKADNSERCFSKEEIFKCRKDRGLLLEIEWK